MPTMPYLHFQGQCADALAFYTDVFAGTNVMKMTYGENPGASADWKASTRLMHAQVTIDDGTLMCSDYPPGLDGDAQKAVSVMQSAPDVPTARARFERLADGGVIIDPIKPSFFSPAFGMVTDKFGTHWIISALPEGPAQGPTP
jgi:PhnB protein